MSMNLRIEDGKVYLKKGGTVGTWGRPVVDDKGVFYPSLKHAAQGLGIMPYVLREVIDKNQTYKDTLFAWATEKEAREFVQSAQKAVDMINAARGYPPAQDEPVKDEPAQPEPAKPEPPKQLELQATSPKLEPVNVEAEPAKVGQTKAKFALENFALTRKQKEAMQQAKAKTKQQQERSADNPFVGVTWPDGAVTVRFAKGGSWSMSRSSRDGIPPEVDVACTWSSF